MRKFFLFFISLLLTSCVNNVEKETAHNSRGEKYILKYASGFSVTGKNGKTVVKVFDPWNKGKVMAKFVLTEGKASKGEIHVPLDSIAVFSATQLNALEKLGKLDAVTGVSDIKYINNKRVRQLIDNGRILEMAAGGTFFTEKIIETKPKAVFYSPFENSKPLPPVLKSLLFIPYLDYTEQNPLGRAEWIKFAALFTGTGKRADSIFNEIERKYDSLKKLVKYNGNTPTVFSGKFFNGQWYVPGGKSYFAQLFKDAGACYVFDYIEKSASVPLDFETVWQKAKDADYWRIAEYSAQTTGYDMLAKENGLYTKFKAFKNRHVIYCNIKKTEYFEKSPLEPYVVLSDFIKAFHPQLLPYYKPVYYKLLK